MRSPQEILFRLRQEIGNLALLVFPRFGGAGIQPAKLSLPESSIARDQVLAVADSVLDHRFPILGITIDTGREIDWRRDYLHKISTGTPYFRRVPYLDFSRVGDHKVIWELNRHQHLVVLAQAYVLTGRREYRDEAFRQLASWMDANPFPRGINWTSALEVGFRALSWIWFWHLTGGDVPERFLPMLYRHGQYLALNLSVYFSPNTHLLGEAVALHALGLFFGEEQWRATGGRIVEHEMERQVRDDGSHFEQSAYYHVYALDMFRFYRTLTTPLKRYDERLRKMQEYLDALRGPSGILPMIGDDDGGKFLWGGPPGLPKTSQSSRLFPDAGIAVILHDDVQIIVKAGPFGEGSGGHSHSDVLSVLLRIGDREILIDPGAYTYVSDPAERDAFRGSAAHNTIRIDGRDQAIPAGPFRWNEKPSVQILEWTGDSIDAACSYGGFTHRRQVIFNKPSTVTVRDRVEGPPGDHTIEQFWHLDAESDAARFTFSAPAERIDTWRSRAFLSKERAVALRVVHTGALPIELETTIAVE